MIGRHPRTLVALLASIAVVAPPARAQQRDHDVAEEITVFEAQVSLDASGLAVIDRQRLRSDQILLLEGGLPRRVTNLETLGSGGWRIICRILWHGCPLYVVRRHHHPKP